MSALQNFVEVLDGLKSMKTGISGTRIKKLTQIAIENVSVSIFIFCFVLKQCKARKG